MRTIYISEQTIETDFLQWADEALDTSRVDRVWSAASGFLAQHAPEYRTTQTTGLLVRAYLRVRNGKALPRTVEREVAVLQEVTLSLNA